ncbi:MAG: hypothetical protein PUB22_04870 [Clostridiales bacterium]|nr:hypothetical protein [Clostridiales bacterium]
MENKDRQWERYLHENEHVVWSGRPEGVKLIDGSSRMEILIQWLIGGLWILLTFVCYVPYALKVGIAGAQLVVVMLVFNCIPLLLFCNPLRICRSLNTSVVFAITNHRVLMKDKENIVSMVVKPDTKVVIRREDVQVGSVCLGSAADKSSYRERSITLHGISHDNVTTGMILFRVKNPEIVADFLPYSEERKDRPVAI